MPKCIAHIEAWLRDWGDRLYHYLVYKKMFTPYEQQKAFCDESVYEDPHYTLCRIEEAVDLGNGDWLLGLRSVYEDGETSGIVHYYRLSEIQLSRFDGDIEIGLCEEETENV